MEVAKQLRPLTLEDAKESYQKLKELDCSSIGKMSRIGLDALDYFFLKHRIKAKTKHHLSFYNVLKDKKRLSYINNKIEQIKDKRKSNLDTDEWLRQRYSVFQLYFGTINQFRPTEVKRILCKYKPTVGVLDFSAGWGGRCLGTMAYGIPYIGIDANKLMEPTYKKMVATLDPDADVRLFFQPSETVDFSKFDYDMVFTSPPYFMLEEYEKMPAYGSKEGFLEKFFRPVVRSAWTNLKTGGTMALNMPKEMYDAIKSELPPLTSRLQLPISQRHPTNAVRGTSLGTHDAKKASEGIYIWRKGAGTAARKTRKVKK